MESALKREVGGRHYLSLSMQPIELIAALDLPFIEGCIVKYICRWRKKGGVSDLEKIAHYLELREELGCRYQPVPRTMPIVKRFIEQNKLTRFEQGLLDTVLGLEGTGRSNDWRFKRCQMMLHELIKEVEK